MRLVSATSSAKALARNTTVVSPAGSSSECHASRPCPAQVVDFFESSETADVLPLPVRSAGQPVPGQVSYEHCVVIFITVQRLTVSSAPRWERPARAVAHHVVRDRPAPSRAPMPPRPARHRSLVAPNMRPGTAWPLPAMPPHRTMCVLVSWHGYRLAGRFQLCVDSDRPAAIQVHVGRAARRTERIRHKRKGGDRDNKPDTNDVMVANRQQARSHLAKITTHTL